MGSTSPVDLIKLALVHNRNELVMLFSRRVAHLGWGGEVKGGGGGPLAGQRGMLGARAAGAGAGRAGAGLRGASRYRSSPAVPARTHGA